MKFIRPTPITDARLTSSTVAETDYAAWNAGTAYVVGNRVIRTSTHRIYERLVNGTTATAPESDPTNWLDIGPTNRWAMFDEVVSTATTASDSMTIVLAPGRINSLALLEVDAETITVDMVVDGSTVYSASLDLTDGSNVGNWYEYFYEPVYQQDSVTITNLVDAALLDIPAIGSSQLTITFTRTGGTVSCGVCVVGLVTDIGSTNYGAEVSIRDYSRKEADAFGNYVLVQRAYSKLLKATVDVASTRVDSVTKEVSRYRATNLVFLGSDDIYGALVVYGFISDWRMVIEAPTFSKFSIEIEGMT